MPVLLWRPRGALPSHHGKILRSLFPFSVTFGVDSLPYFTAVLIGAEALAKRSRPPPSDRMAQFASDLLLKHAYRLSVYLTACSPADLFGGKTPVGA